ncbi:hypothetical protein [Flavobacterium nackdongense]|uniref:hypothetical protein n=1 Tax=Flavobacterium nackdongense TaxID=2547394 RepID=UPI0013FCFE17|nr:hypothetical protein [Flavobacterium nackdongense]
MKLFSTRPDDMTSSSGRVFGFVRTKQKFRQDELTKIFVKKSQKKASTAGTIEAFEHLDLI